MKAATRPLPRSAYDEAARYSSLSSLPPNPNPSLIKASIFWQAEQSVQKIIQSIHPTVASEQRRMLIVQYMQNFIGGVTGLETFPFGSFPLKTYLPDGDIDLTVIGTSSYDDALVSLVRDNLEKEEQNKDSEFEVKDVQYIGAEVKVVKCVVQNIVVDISFSQIGGLCTLCFLEQVDQFIGKNHLFKRSIILIKAWCYYESRVLGSFHGLISTYALETLVLYIFNLFHSSLDGPLSVLYRFLDYYSKFEWDKYCISLQGPVLLSSLPELTVETVDNDGGDLLLTEEFVRSCVDFFSVPMKVSEGKPRTFTRKVLNIVDPLRENNNLGRSVSPGNFYRIRSAFIYGARKLGQVLLLPAGSIGDEINLFFMSTLDRHGVEERPDVQVWVPRSMRTPLAESSGVELMQPVEKIEKEKEKEKADELSSESLTFKDSEDLNKEIKNVRISGLDEREAIVAPQESLSDKQQNSTSGEADCISSERLTGDAKDLATSRTSVLKSMTESSNTSSSMKEDSILDFRNVHHAPHLFFNPESQTRKDLNVDQINSKSLGPSSIRALNSNEEIIVPMQPDSYVPDSSLDNTGLVGNFGDGYAFESFYLVDHGVEGNFGNRIIDPSFLLNEISDLTGDYDMHLNNLNYAVWCHELIKSSHPFPMYPSPPSGYYIHGPDLWTHGSMLTGPLSPRPLFSPTAGYSMNLPFISSSRNTGDAPKRRGIGTYFPNMAYREQQSPGRVRNAVPANHPATSKINSQADTPQEDTSSVEKGSPELTIQTQSVFGENERGKLPAQSDIPLSSSPHGFMAPPNPGGIVPLKYPKLEFGSLGPVSLDFPISHSQGFGFTSPSSSSLRPTMSSSKGRKSQSYQLKDEDFPPLSG